MNTFEYLAVLISIVVGLGPYAHSQRDRTRH
jgi:hypothetical protein